MNLYDEKKPIYSRPNFLPGPKIKRAQITQSIICEGCTIDAEEITRCVIGIRSHIKQGTILRDTILLGNHSYMPQTIEGKEREPQFWIGENCLIEKAIIDEAVQIGNHVKLINKDKHTQYDGNGLFVRDGIILIPSGTKLPNNFEF
jgi:glucose-1-phosphate adenylyltransferase